MGTINRTVMAWLTVVLLLACAPLGLAAPPGLQSATGEVGILSAKAKTLSLQPGGKDAKFFSFTDATEFRNARDIREIAVGDRLTVEYVVDRKVNVAVTITKMVAPMPAGIGIITTEELETLVDKGPEQGRYLLIDARPEAKFRNGHIRTAVSAPFASFAENPKRYLPEDKGTTVIFYCEGLTCDMSARSAELAVRAGHEKVLVYPEGERGWKKTDYCIASSTEYIRSGNIVLIDLRRPEEVRKGHIPRAVNIPIQELDDAEDLFPRYKGAAIVFYGDTVEDLRLAVSTVRDWDYKNISAYVGGLADWTAKGYPLEQGPAATTIHYVRELLPQEMGAEEFSKVIESDTYQLVDVRTREEFDHGHLKNAINLPLEELLREAGALPRNRPGVLYCSTGTRGEMAYQILKGKGLDIRYFSGSIEFGRDGKYFITE